MDSTELDFIRKAIKSDFDGLGRLVDVRFSEMNRRMDDAQDVFDLHDRNITALNAWKNNAVGSMRTLAYITACICGIVGAFVLI